jgi:hypothetical protein
LTAAALGDQIRSIIDYRTAKLWLRETRDLLLNSCKKGAL